MPARPAGPVLDLAGAIDPPALAELDRLCRRIDASGKGVLVVAVLPSLEGDSIESYANRLFAAWGIGHKDRNNGVLLLVSMGDRKVRIETGYGVEALLPDGRCGEIIRRDILPKFKAGDPAGGMLAGAVAIVAALEGQPATRRSTRSPGADLEAWFADAGDTGTRLLMLSQVIGLLLGPLLVASWWTAIPGRGRVAKAGLGAIGYGFAAPWLAWLPLQLVVCFVGCMLASWVLEASSDRPRRRRGGGGWWDPGHGDHGGGGFGGGGGGSFGGFDGGSSGGGGASGDW